MYIQPPGCSALFLFLAEMVEHVYGILDSAVQSCSLTPKITLLGDINPAVDYLSKMVNQTWSPRDLPAELATQFLFAGAA